MQYELLIDRIVKHFPIKLSTIFIESLINTDDLDKSIKMISTLYRKILLKELYNSEDSDILLTDMFYVVEDSPVHILIDKTNDLLYLDCCEKIKTDVIRNFLLGGHIVLHRELPKKKFTMFTKNLSMFELSWLRPISSN